MHKCMTAALLGVVGLLGLLANTAEAQGQRQGYGKWSWSSRGYHYRSYYYKPYAGYAGYKRHYAIYYPSRPRYVYYYNPHSKKFWGRYDCVAGGYSMLAEQDRRAKVCDISPCAFPRPTRMPAIPESTDGARMAEPPDLPQ